ncbi:MAG: carboxypeptidase-like regulatory domain-containing protein [Anaerolineae bacterium]
MDRSRTTALRLSIALSAAAFIVGSAALRMPPPAAIAQRSPQCDGVITGTVRTAALVGATARPVAGAHVVLLAATASGNPTVRTGAEVLTDADGAYRHQGVCDGAYIVRAYVETSAGVLSGFHDPNGDGAADVVTLDGDHRALGAIDVVLALGPLAPAPTSVPRATDEPRATAVPCAFSDGAIAGTVFGPDGRPFEGAYVSVRPFTAQVSNAAGRSAVTGADGAYRVGELCEGRYQVAAYARTNTGGLTGSYDANGDGQADAVGLTIDARSAAGIDIHLAAAATPAPRATEPPRNPAPAPTAVPPSIGAAGAIAGTVTAADGSPVAGARVLAIGSPGRNAATAATTTVVAVTDADGVYRLAPLGWGAYTIVAVEVDPLGVSTGFYDPDHDGLPNAVGVSQRQPTVSGIDIEMPARITAWSPPRVRFPIEPAPRR